MKAYVVERKDLIENIQLLRKRAGATPIWAVLKGNGYGIGIVPLAKILTEQGIHQFCVTEIREAQQLRDAGFTEEKVLMLRSIADPDEIDRLLDLKVILTIGSFETAVAVNAVAAARSDMADVHLKIDTGMGRYGFFPSDTQKMIDVYRSMKNTVVCGIYTHFNQSYGSAKRVKAQFAAFSKAVRDLQAAGYETGTVHCCNSSAFLRFPEMFCDGVRLGSAILGRVAVRTDLKLKKIGHLEATIEEIRWLPKGHSCGYDGAWTAKEPTQVAIVNVGWYNGFGIDRSDDTFTPKDSIHGILHYVKNLIRRPKILVTINGKKCRTLGHIAMVHTFVDVTKIKCAVGDTVIIQQKPLLIKGIPVQYR